MQPDEQLSWRKSSFSSSNPDCVELAVTGGETRVRDTKQRQGGTLAFSRRAFAAFLEAQKGRSE